MRVLFALTLCALSSSIACGVDSVSSIADKSTHKTAKTISMEKGAPTINAFCLNAEGLIVAACGNGPGELRILDDEGSVISSWEVAVKPEAVNVKMDQSILVAGEGKIFHYSPDGKLLATAESPHALRLKGDDEELRKAAIASLKQTSGRGMLEARIATYESIISQIEKRAEEKELTAAEKQMLATLPDTLEIYKEQLASLGEDDDGEKGPTEEAIKRQIGVLVKSKMRISSICSSKDAVFVTTRALTGYGYDIWKTDAKLDAGEIIVEGLRGCCGQMDVQCCEKGLFVAENSADRVVHYDFNGKEISHWGKSDRKGVDGFGSCCNPMNVCFDSEGFIYTAEASLGRIKKFDASGKRVAFVGDVDLVPGCKNVSIAVSPVNGNVYMLDLTRNHIAMMQPKAESQTNRTAALPTADSTKEGVKNEQ